MLVLGDAHASHAGRREALMAAYQAVSPEFTLQVGDLECYDLPAPTWFIAGNNEDFDVIDALRRGERPDGVTNAQLLASTVATVDGLRVAGLSGNFAPTRYNRSRSSLQGERRRHFTHADIERAATLDDIDIFLSHEGPTGLLYQGYDPGTEHVTNLLKLLDPDLCLVGHHHQHVAGSIAGVRTVSLAPVWEQYYTLDTDSLELTAHEMPVDAAPSR